MTQAISSPFHLLCCRPGAEPFLQQELETRHGIHSRPFVPGMIQVEGSRLPEAPLVFEWQRLQEARFVPLAKGESVSETICAALWRPWVETPEPWAAHVFPLEEADAGGASRLQGIARELIRKGNRLHPGLLKWERKPEKLIRNGKGMILQWTCTEKGLIFCGGPATGLTSPVPGGRTRMKMDPRAPSRSYLKIEEAFVRMGREPRENETVIDLGAAPGGWSFAFAKRGCQVTAIDNGPLKIDDACVRRIEHLHRDGLSYQLNKLQPSVDWLVGDMLIPPGQAFGLLRYWLGEAHCRNLVLNIKLPQLDPLPALNPILDWLAPHLNLQTRQLYHDRREVTVFGSVSS
ncbi:MAG: SAM-dependent methyltransferase [Kiritimatiellia bacterium]